ncbi:MAG TPA: hypothetical protein OQH54_05805 [Nitrosopumilus sp.]|nr:hypothetical protein [Thermoproteota archaeon]HJJ23209.1 hypothetical protein [Nitrosopumilus sp.]
MDELLKELATDLSVLPIVISSITATIFAITLIITWKNIKENTRATHSQLLRSFHEDLINRLNKNIVLKTTEDCQRYANDYLNTVDEIAYLELNRKIPSHIATYLKRFFAYGLMIIDWYNEMVGEDFRETTKKNWPNYLQYCKKYGIISDPDDKLPKVMLDYNKLRENES